MLNYQRVYHVESLYWITIWLFNIAMEHGSLNVPIEHHPTIRYMVYNGYCKVMSNIPKMGQLPTPVENGPCIDGLPIKNGDFPWLC